MTLENDGEFLKSLGIKDEPIRRTRGRKRAAPSETVRDDRIGGETFRVQLRRECQASVGDDVVLRTALRGGGGAYEEWLGTLTRVGADGRLLISSYYGGDMEFLYVVTAEQLRRSSTVIVGVITGGSPLKRPART